MLNFAGLIQSHLTYPPYSCLVHSLNRMHSVPQIPCNMALHDLSLRPVDARFAAAA